jgi:hypothetical protein
MSDEKSIITHSDRFETWWKSQNLSVAFEKAYKGVCRTAFIAGAKGMLPRDEDGKVRQRG